MSTNDETMPITMPADQTAANPTTTLPAAPQLLRPISPKTPSTANKKPVVIGLYGLPGCGKSHLLSQLQQALPQHSFAFHEGSAAIAAITPGGLSAFQQLPEPEKQHHRQLAISTIQNTCRETGQAAVVAGHFMFWSEDEEEEEKGEVVCTKSDLEVYTHILYLDTPIETILERRRGDNESGKRGRLGVSVEQLAKWKQEEEGQLRSLCREHGILFCLVSGAEQGMQEALVRKASKLLRDFGGHDEEYNLLQAARRLDEVLEVAGKGNGGGKGRLETVLVLDADRTLAAEDTGALFWKKASRARNAGEEEGDPLKTLFSSSLGYSYTAFRQATLLYEETADDQAFDAICSDVASSVTMYPEFISLLHRIAKTEHIRAVVVSCGVRLVWEKVLSREGLSDTVKVIAGGRITDGVVVTAAVKATLVERLKDFHGVYVWAFGDSPLDLEMLKKADEAIVVVGAEGSRSKSMERALGDAIDNGGMKARQALLPSRVSLRLDIMKLPLVDITGKGFIDSILCDHNRYPGIQILHATDKTAAKLLMTPMRDANNSGPALREAHRRVGWYLATEFLSTIIGTEEYAIPHVQGNYTSGYRLLHEQQTSIVALMRGGEPMAFGVNDAFPLAMFVHANHPEDLKIHHLQGQHTVVLVDSVVNSGKTVVQFVQHIRKMHDSIQIAVVAGVVQKQCVSEGSFAEVLGRDGKLSLVALRLSDNKFTGTGTTDTGNRLFNTTHLP